MLHPVDGRISSSMATVSTVRAAIGTGTAPRTSEKRGEPDASTAEEGGEVWVPAVTSKRLSWSGPFQSRHTVATGLTWDHNPPMPVVEPKRSGRGRPSVDSERSRSRARRPLIDAWSADQSEPVVNRADAVRRALTDCLRAKGHLLVANGEAS